MRSGFGTGDEKRESRQRDALAWRLQCRNGGHRRWRQRCNQGEATDAAIVDANFAVTAVRGGRGLARKIGVADDAWLRCRSGCHLRAAEIGEQAGKRNRIGGGERDKAPLQQPFAEKLMHRPEPRSRSPQTANTLAAKKFQGEGYELIPWRASTSRTAATRSASGTARCACACFCKCSSRPFSSFANSAPTTRSLIVTSPLAFSSEP